MSQGLLAAFLSSASQGLKPFPSRAEFCSQFTDLLFSRRIRGCAWGRMGCSCPRKHRGKPAPGQRAVKAPGPPGRCGRMEGRWRWPRALSPVGGREKQGPGMWDEGPGKPLGRGWATKGGSP